MSPPRVVAIDGAAGSGKSTLARGLARALGLPYVNTGWMYRALAAAADRSGARSDDAPSLMELMASLRFTLRGVDPTELEVEGYRQEELTSLAVEETVSAVSRHPAVRTAMRDAQRRLGDGGAVMEGRDIGSVVFPDAPVKLYLTADPSARTARRADERAADGSAVAAALRARDEHDAVTNPLEPAAGAIVVDTGRLGIAETLAAALAIVAEVAPWLLPGGDA